MASATTMTIDFSRVTDIRQHKSGVMRDKTRTDLRPRSAEGKLLTPKQIRARARRRNARNAVMTDQEFDALYKPVEEWDLEELARGRPRNSAGKFSGPKPSWIKADVHERAMELFKQAIKTEMNALTPTATTAISHMLQNEEVDERGKPVVPFSVKLDAAKFLLEHTVGKPKQTIESELSVKLQGLLGTVMVNPTLALTPGASQPAPFQIGHLPGVTLPMGSAADIVDAEEIDDEYDNG